MIRTTPSGTTYWLSRLEDTRDLSDTGGGASAGSLAIVRAVLARTEIGTVPTNLRHNVFASSAGGFADQEHVPSSNPEESNAATGHLVHIGRQPIFDRDGEVVAYELLFRGGLGDMRRPRQSLYATSQIIVNAFTEFGLEQIASDRLCFINITRDFLVGELPLPFEPGQAVLEILGDVYLDDDAIAGVERLVDQGYPVAVDDDLAVDLHQRLWELAAFVKINVRDRVAGELDNVVAPFRRMRGIRLVAEGVDTPEHVAMAEALGFELLQGKALGQPQVMSIQSLSPSRMRRLELLGALNAEDVDLETVVSIVTGDPGLSFRVLRATNSAASGLNRKISSVRDAVVLLGMVKIRQWVALMLLSDIAESATDDQLATTMTRARLCQTVAERLDTSADAAFTVGLLAGIADLISEPVSDLVRRLPLAEEIVDALVHGSGRLGQVLSMVRAYESSETHALQSDLVPPAELAKAYLAAVGWSVRTVDGVIGSGSHTRRRLPPASELARRAARSRSS
jgi:EAL and modified HD-GYP domain-containing signal transduction protein